MAISLVIMVVSSNKIVITYEKLTFKGEPYRLRSFGTHRQTDRNPVTLLL